MNQIFGQIKSITHQAFLTPLLPEFKFNADLNFNLLHQTQSICGC